MSDAKKLVPADSFEIDGYEQEVTLLLKDVFNINYKEAFVSNDTLILGR